MTSKNVQITYAAASLVQSFYKVLASVAEEAVYIEMVEAPAYEKVQDFQLGLMQKNHPIYYAVVENEVVGWIDISLLNNPRMQHRGFLGMGVRKDYRGQKIGSQLLAAALKHAKDIGLEKVELTVYTDNMAGLALYKKYGFEEIGVIRKFRKHNNRYFDALKMELFFN